MDRTIVRLAHEILERTTDIRSLVLVGIRRRGVPLAERLARKIAELEKAEIPVGVLDITLYRDDLSQVGHEALVNKTEIHFPIAGKDVLLVDDVLYTGRTVRAAMDALFELGRPARVQLLALIDRGHRELPIEAQYTGRVITTTARQFVEVKFHETDGTDRVLLAERGETQP